MITIVQIFQIIENNNFEDLTILMNCDKKFNYNVLNKNNISLLYIAVKYRSKECFDLLLTNNNLTILNSSSYYINPLHIAIEYYINARNYTNKYYVDKLLEHNTTITTVILKKTMCNIDLFNILFLRVKDKLEDKQYNEIIEYICIENKLNILEYIYKNINNNNISFINKLLFKYSIHNDNICIINYLEKYNFNFLLLNSEPSIYYALSYYNETHNSVFNYLFNIYSNKTFDELNSIPNIYSFNFINFNFNSFLSIISKYMLLSLDFHKIIISLISKILNFNGFIYKNNICLIFNIIYIIIKYKKLNIIYDININFIPINYTNEKLLIKLLYIIEHFKIKVCDNLLSKLNSINKNHDNKTKFISELDTFYTKLYKD